MAALCPNISYGLSQSISLSDNKEVIFVKLTDSAYRAIEDYQKNQVGRSSTSPEALKKDIQRKIIAEFQRTISDSQKQQEEERFQFLHQKLSRIKDLIHDYDESLV